MKEMYRLKSVKKVALYPDIYLEGKIELLQESQNGYSKKYVYLAFPKDEVINNDTEYNCYHYQLEDMYDNSDFIYHINHDTAIVIMKKMKQIYSNFD